MASNKKIRQSLMRQQRAKEEEISGPAKIKRHLEESKRALRQQNADKIKRTFIRKRVKK